MNVASTTSSASSSGLSGLASGMETDKMVEALLANAQSKIDKQNALKQQTLWKQEAYRSIISKLNTFQTKYFSSTSSNNLLSQNFYNLMTAVTKSENFKVTATSSASVGATKVSVKQLASNSKLTSGQAVSGTLNGNISAEKLDEYVQSNKDAERKVVFKAGSKEVTVDLKDVFVDSDGNYTSEAGRTEAIAAKINAAFENASVSGVSAKIVNGTLSITNTNGSDGIRVTSDSTELGLKALGLSAGNSGSAYGDTSVLSSTINTKNSFSIDVTLDDNKKTINLDLEAIIDTNGRVDLARVATEFTDKLNRAHGTGQISVAVNTATGGISLNTSAGRKVMIGGSPTALAAFGYKNGQSNRVGMGGTLAQQAFATELQGSKFSFKINGVNFEFGEDATMTEVMNKINSSGAGVRVVYKTLEDKFVMESSSSGKGFDIQMSQSEGNLLNAMFGDTYNGNTLTSGSKVTGNTLTKSTIASTGINPGLEDGIESGTFTIKVDGTEYKFTFPKRETTVEEEVAGGETEEADETDGTGETGETGATSTVVNRYSKNEIISELNAKMKEAFGNEDIQLDENGNIINNSSAAITVASTDLSSKLGLSGATSTVSGSTKLSELGLSGEFMSDLGVTDDTTIEELTGREFAQGSFTFANGKLGFEANTESPVTVSFGSADDMNKLFGESAINLNSAGTVVASYVSGDNAKLIIDGVETERSSNTFSINGLNFDLKAVSPKDSEGNIIEEVIDVSRGTDQIVEGIKSFMNDYNSLIEELNNLVREEANYKKYDPLTDAQKKEMTDKEIELWEQKAKEGLLKGDSTITGLLQAMRSALYEKPAGSLFAIYDLGIETSSDWKDNGKLVFSADGEAKLRQAIESNPEDVMRLFSAEEGGLAVKLNDIIKSAANTSSASPGSLVQIAGVKGKASDTNNDIYKRLNAIQAKIDALKASYEKEKTRYWRQFNSMESLISNMNSQSSWLTAQLGS